MPHFALSPFSSADAKCSALGQFRIAFDQLPRLYSLNSSKKPCGSSIQNINLIIQWNSYIYIIIDPQIENLQINFCIICLTSLSLLFYIFEETHLNKTPPKGLQDEWFVPTKFGISKGQSISNATHRGPNDLHISAKPRRFVKMTSFGGGFF